MSARRRRKRGKYKEYTDEQRDAVLADVSSLGQEGAAKKHGIPSSTVGNWKRRRRGAASGALSERDARAAADRARQAEGPEVADVSQKPDRTKDGSDGTPRRHREKLARALLRRGPARLYTPSQKAEILEFASGEGVTAAHQNFGVSRFTIYDWQKKVKRAAAGKGDAPTAGPAPQDLEALRDKEILDEWKKHPGLGPSQIRNQLRRRGIKAAVGTVRDVMVDKGYRPPKVKREPHDKRFEAVRPNHLWHLDFVHQNINRADTFTLILIDDCSRYVVGHGVDDAERADLVIETFNDAVRRHGRPEIVIHDKGSAFWSWRGTSRFTALLTEMGIDQIAAEYKEWNGKVEVFNANLRKEFFNVQRFYDVAEMRRKLEIHVHWYNHERTSHALGGLLVPADRFYGRDEEVLARIEAGAGGEPSDALDLRHRALDLFKVVAHNGVPEVWLMGLKIFGPPP